MLVLIAAGCKKSNNNTGNVAGKHRGVVIKNACCQIAIQYLGTELSVPEWTDSSSTMLDHYDHAFAVANPCQIGNLKQGDTISFNVIDPQAQNCACCLLYTDIPKNGLSIQLTK